jgi:hypothetical protein
MPLNAAMKRLDRDHTWRRFKLDYPEVSFGRFTITRFDIPPDSGQRREITRHEGEDRDPGYGTGFCKLLEYALPGDAEAGEKAKVLWMSDTKAEIMEHYPLFNQIVEQRARRMLINGLGLGLAVHGALQFPWVEHIDVVEINNELVSGIAPLINSDKVAYHIGNAFSIKLHAEPKWDLAWHDIWPQINGDNVPQMDRLRRKYEFRTRWQGCWQQECCQAMAAALKRAKDGAMTADEAFRILVLKKWPMK